MTRLLSCEEAMDMIETVFETGIETLNLSLVEAFIGDMDVARAKADVESYLAYLASDVDLDSIQITPDQTDDPPGIDCVRITIRTGAV